jgi:DNA-binding MarR family transcriptional regulator
MLPPSPAFPGASFLLRLHRVARKDLELDNFVPYRLSIASNAVSVAIARTYEARFELKMHEWRVMAVLHQDGELTQQELVGRTRMDKVTISRAAQVLEGRGLVRRVPNADDGRSLRLSLTAAGKQLHARVAPAAIELEARVLAGLSASEVTALKAMLRRIETAATQLLTEE